MCRGRGERARSLPRARQGEQGGLFGDIFLPARRPKEPQSPATARLVLQARLEPQTRGAFTAHPLISRPTAWSKPLRTRRAGPNDSAPPFFPHL